MSTIIHEMKSSKDHDKMISTLELDGQLNYLGTSLSYLFRYSTCYYACQGGRHILESYAGRAYNLSLASFILIRRGFYDESFNCTRSLGEISNIIFLFISDYPKSIDEWFKMIPKKREQEFKPAAVRRKIETLGLSELLPMKPDLYKFLCESSTHIVPQTTPNVHNSERKGMIGGLPQEQGLKKSLEILADITGITTILFAKTFNRFQDIQDFANSHATGSSGPAFLAPE